MSLYSIITLFFIMLTVLIYERNSKVLTENSALSLDSMCFYAQSAIMITMMMLCADRSPDYRAYKTIYYLAPETIDFSSKYYTSYIHTEIGWKLLSNLFHVAGVSFEWYIAIICGISCCLLVRYIHNYCNDNKTLSLFWLFGSFCLAYYYIGIRMGVIISVFLGVLLPALEDGKYIKYIIGVIFCSFIHTVSFMYLLLIPMKLLDSRFVKKMLFIVVCFGTILMVTGRGDIMYRVIPAGVGSSAAYGMEVADNYSMLQLVYRLLFAGIVLYCDYYTPEKSKIDENLYKYYYSGVMFYFLFAGVPILGSRVFDMVKPLETCFVSDLLGTFKRKDIIGRIAFFGAVCLCIFMVAYHISALKGYFVETRLYTIVNYPYRSIINI